MKNHHVYLVTGGAHRLGLAISEALLENGDRVIATWHTDRQEAESFLSRHPASAGIVQADFSQPQTMGTLFSEALAWFGRIDGIVNNASSFSPKTVEDCGIEDVRMMLDIHASSPLLLAQAFYRWVTDQHRQGAVVNITDSHADSGFGRKVPYLLGKASLASETRILAKALAPSIRVNAVAPGFVLPQAGEEELFAKQHDLLPLGKTGTVQDVTAAVLYLLDASFVTGETIHVDGGGHLV